MAKNGDALLLPVTLAQGETLFLVDTGTSYSTFDISLRPVLGEKKDSTKIVTPRDVVSIDLYAAPDARIGNLPFSKRSLVSVADLEVVREELGYEIYGILGMDFLSQHICRIDFDNGTFRFLESASGQLGKGLPMMFRRHGLPYVVGAMTKNANEQMGFQIDTGDLVNSGSLGSEIFTILVSRGLISHINETPAWGLGGTNTSRVGIVKYLAIGTFSHSNLSFTESKYNRIGLSYLARFVVTFDFPNGMMYLEKGKRFDSPELSDASGMDFVKVQSRVEVTAVSKRSPADDAGVQVGDVLLKCGQLDAGRTSLFALRWELCRRGEEIEMALLRNGVERSVRLSLEE